METEKETTVGFNDEERLILDAEYLKAHVDTNDIKAKIYFWQHKDGVETGVHYQGMGYDDEKTQDETVLRVLEYGFLMDCGYYKAGVDYQLA